MWPVENTRISTDYAQKSPWSLGDTCKWWHLFNPFYLYEYEQEVAYHASAWEEFWAWSVEILLFWKFNWLYVVIFRYFFLYLFSVYLIDSSKIDG